jgi:ABC-type transport system involved in cytochrome c biogenesis permease subunit
MECARGTFHTSKMRIRPVLAATCCLIGAGSMVLEAHRASRGDSRLFAGLAVIVGSTWAFVELGTSWVTDPKIAISLFTWGIYLAMVFLRVSAGWRGRKAAVLAITALGCSALTWAAHVQLQNVLVR